MEIKKTQQTVVAEQDLSTARVKNFVADIKSEIQKVTWTSRDELRAYTKIVVLTTLAFGMSIYLMDLIIQGALGGLSFILRFIGG